MNFSLVEYASPATAWTCFLSWSWNNPNVAGAVPLVTLMAHEGRQSHEVRVRHADWYDKTLPTFVDTLADVRRGGWKVPTVRMSAPGGEMIQVPLDIIERLAEVLCYAASP